MPLPFQHIHILVIEDNVGDYVLIEDYLNEEISDATILRAGTFSEAKALVSREKFDIILLDLTLPDASGEQLIYETLECSGETPVIVLTGYSNKHFGIKTLSMGMSDYLLKDELSPSQLFKSIAYSIERKKINNELRNSEHKYRNLFHSSPIPMWVYDPESLRFLDVNAAACVQYQYERNEFLNLTLLDIHPAGDKEKVVQIARVNNETQSYFNSTVDLLKKNGQLIHVNVQSSSIEFSRKKARLVIANDVTEKLLAQAEREKLIADLSQTNKDLKQFSYITSHNLRGPIAQLLGLTNLLDMYPVEDTTLAKILDGIKTAARNFDETVKDLAKVLDIKENTPIAKEEIALQSCLEKVLKTFHPVITNNGISIDFDFSEAPTVSFNSAFLENIFSNLLSNSIKYSSKSKTPNVSIKSSFTDNHLVITFSDNGVGMDLNLCREKLFGLYQRFHPNTEGKGMGLFLVKSQLEALNGRIQVESEPDNGAIFTLFFERNNNYRSAS